MTKNTSCQFIRHDSVIDSGMTFKAMSSSGFSDEDKTFLGQLYASTRWEEVQQAPWSNDQRHSFLQDQFNAQYQHYLSHYPKADYRIICKDNQPIGRIYTDKDETSICLIDIAFLPEYKYQGLGSVLLTELLNEAQKEGLKVVIHVENFNPAYQWYVNHGFQQVEDKGVYQYMEWNPEILD